MWKWTNKKIAFVAILVAASVSFIIIGSRLAAITTFPPVKIAFGGLPIKITGYLFGPLIGAVTGVIADLLSFALLPTYYHPLYTLIMAVSGFVPGLVAWIFVKRKVSNNVNYFSCILVLTTIFISVFCAIQFLPASAFKESPIKQRWILQLLACGGYVVIGIVATFFKFWKGGKHVSLICPIIIFISILEVHNSLMTPLADNQSLHSPFAVFWIGHLIASPAKLISNLIIISFTVKVVAPLVQNKLKNSYE